MAARFSDQKRSILSSKAVVQVPWIKVIIGNYTFGVFEKSTKAKSVMSNDENHFYLSNFKVRYPNFIKNLEVQKINGIVNNYFLNISYPVTDKSDPDFFEKVFSSVSKTRKIVFSYGDASNPSFIYKDEEAIITNVQKTLAVQSSVITYRVQAISTVSKAAMGSYNFLTDGALHQPSTIIKNLITNPYYGLSKIFTGITKNNINDLIASDDMAVKIDTKLRISVLDYITYLVSCMIPSGTTNKNNISNDIYILTIHDETSYDSTFNDTMFIGPYFRVSRTSYKSKQEGAFTIDVGFDKLNTSTIVTDFSVDYNQYSALCYDYQRDLQPENYSVRIDENGSWIQEYTPAITSKNTFKTEPEDITWWTKITQYPIKANITIQGLLRPALLMTYLRINVIFPGGHKSSDSGLYIITQQRDIISESGYRTQLGLTRISGDADPNIN